MAFVADQFFYTDMPGQVEFVGFDQFLDLSSTYGDDHSATVNSTSPDMGLSYDADMLGDEFSQHAYPTMTNDDFSQDPFLDQSTDMGLMSESTPAFDNAMFHDYASFDFRQMVEAQAAADPRIASAKEKRREAAIALHLQRLCDATALEVDMSSDSNTSFSSPNLSDYTYESFSPQSDSASPKHTSAPPPTQPSGSMELVLDLNMNATTNLPKKQKPRSQAQKENYIKARKYGACEKHKKQHKRCNCLEKAAVRAGVTEAPPNVAFKERPMHPRTPMSIVPNVRLSTVSGVPGHVPTFGSSSIRPTATMIKKLGSTDVSQRGSSLSTASVKHCDKAVTSQNGTAAGRDLRLRPTAVAVQPTVRDGKHTSDSPGHVQFQSIQVARKPTIQSSSRIALGISPTSNATVSMGGKSQTLSRACCPDSRAPDFDVRRPRGIDRSHVRDGFPTATTNANRTQTSMEVRKSGLLPVSGSTHRPVVPQRSRQSLEIHSNCAQHAPKRESAVTKTVTNRIPTCLFGQTGSVLHSVTSQASGLVLTTVFSVASAWQASLSLASSSETLIYRGLSFAGKHLMSAKKGLQLHRMQTFWSA